MDKYAKYILNEVAGYYNAFLLTEARSTQQAVLIFQKANPNINCDELAMIMMVDPTAVENKHGSFIGKYGMWIGNQYVKGNIHRGDILELRSALNTYNINKSQIGKNINDFESLDDLVSVVSQYNDSFKASRTLSKGEQALEKAYEDKNFVIYIPHTWEAARKIGGDTNW